MGNVCVRKEGANLSEVRKAEFTGLEGRHGFSQGSGQGDWGLVTCFEMGNAEVNGTGCR